MNQIVIKGRLARSPELKTVNGSKGDTSICTFTVATDRRFGEESDFFECQAWGKTGEFVNKFFHKGQEILVSGEMQCHPYEKEGQKRYPWRINAGQIEFCGSKKDNATSQPATQGIPEGFEVVDDDEDIPF